jgi:hypothetical protein
MKDVMIDLETLGQSAGCIVLSIGAVAFDENGTGREFYAVLSRSWQEAYGLRAEEATMLWWDQQSPEARRVLDLADHEDGRVYPVLHSLALWMPENARVWSNGASFDLPILSHLYKVMGFPVPWKYWNERCYRTLKSLCPVAEVEREGTHHNALDDARYQARCAGLMLKRIADSLEEE